MVLGGPRSGTTWAANWLTTDTTMCLHDPLLEYKIEFLQRLRFDGKKLGISCTSATLYPEWVNAQRCPKVVLVRDIHEINRSLEELGLVQLIPAKHEARLAAVKDALFIDYEKMFTHTGGQMICDHLGLPFSADRHDLLSQMRIEPMWARLNVGKEAAAALVKRIVEAR